MQGIGKGFGTHSALVDVSLEIGTGELVALLGPSGAGKTTLLRIVGGLETPDSGSVYFHGHNATQQSLRDRQVGFVFQHYALFRHMTVFENVAFGLRVRPKATRPKEMEIKRRVMKLLELVHLGGMARRFPDQLSGGQRQRVALARALAVEPKVLLLDEPFGALDAKVRQELRRWLRRLHDDLHTTSVFVTHDQEEAMEVADRVVIMNQGRIEQYGTPDEVYHHPVNQFVYNFIGNVNLFQGRVEGERAYVGGLGVQLPEWARAGAKTARIAIRPHLLELNNHPDGAEHFAARIDHINPAGPIVKIELTAEWGEPFSVELAPERYRSLRLERAQRVYVSLKEEKVFVTPDDSALVDGGGI